jgi:hypothetical protein
MNTDLPVLRRLAQRWMELASLPVMGERKRLWTALKDRVPERPMVLFETWTVQGYVGENELECQDPQFREVERVMRRMTRQAEEIGDDVVLEPCWPVDWIIENDGYGVSIIPQFADDAHGGQIGFHYNHPIRSPEDIALLRPRSFQVKRAETFEWKTRLEEAFGGILPVRLRGTGGHCAALAYDLFRLIGNDNLMTWFYDAPEAVHQILTYLRDDRLAYYAWLEREGLLALNNNDVLVGSGSPGYTTTLPGENYAGQPRLCDLWISIESQETTMISPRMFARFFLPYMAEVARLFGLVYYGCCEPVHDRWEPIIQAVPNIRAVSISPWCEMRTMGEKLGREIIFSRKPKPWLISGSAPDWSAIEADLDETLSAARDGCLEIIYRDVYSINDRSTLHRWLELVRSRIGGE